MLILQWVLIVERNDVKVGKRFGNITLECEKKTVLSVTIKVNYVWFWETHEIKFIL